MRKILLGTTAVVGTALLTPSVGVAQEAPTVRIGGFFQGFYGYTQQTGTVATNLSMNTIGGSDTNGAGGNANASARLGHSDFNSDAEVHVFVNGKAANGMAYGAVIELAFNQQEGAVRNNGRRTVDDKTTGSIDEMYAFVSSPRLGQLRFGDEDGPLGGLMNAGFITNFGSGGVYGAWESFTVRPNRTTTSPGGLGDNTKVIYLSPQFYGFDFGTSFALNEGSGEDTGCLNSFSSINCDRAYAITGSQGTARSHNLPGRLNELQAVLRWRGNIAGVGIAASAGGMWSSVIRDIDVNGNIRKNLQSPQVYQLGLQGTYLGFTLGANFMTGTTSYFYIPTGRGAKPMEQWFVGASYTYGPITVGANAFWGSYAQLPTAIVATPNGGFVGSNYQGGLLSPSQRRSAISIGGNYRLAPGMDIVVEWTMHQTKTPGISNNFPIANINGTSVANIAAGGSGGNNVNDRAVTNVLLTGIRLAF